MNALNLETVLRRWLRRARNCFRVGVMIEVAALVLVACLLLLLAHRDRKRAIQAKSRSFQDKSRKALLTGS